MTTVDVAIVGAGPAGIAAAIQLNRHGITPIIFGCKEMGGLLRNANLVENYPGFPRGISGVKLVELIIRQLRESNPAMVDQTVQKLDFNEEEFELTTKDKTFTSTYLLLATGTKAKVPEVQGLNEALGSRVFSEILPIRNVQSKRIAVIGGGDAAFDYALNLSKSNRVEIYNRGSCISCLPLLWERAIKLENIKYHEHFGLTDVSQKAKSIVIKGQQEGTVTEDEFDYLMIAIGRVPNLDCISASLASKLPELEREERIFKIGDVGNGQFRQASIAMGQGIEAAMKIAEKLTGLKT